MELAAATVVVATATTVVVFTTAANQKDYDKNPNPLCTTVVVITE